MQHMVTKSESDIREVDRQSGANGAYDLFVSYSHLDKKRVSPILEALRQAKLNVFDPLASPKEMWGRDLRTWFDEIFPLRARAAMIFLSKQYSKSKWCKTEFDQMVRLTRENPDLARLLPVRLDESPIPTQAAEFVFLDVQSQTPTQIAKLTKTKLAELEGTLVTKLDLFSDEELLKRIAEERDSQAFDVLYKRIYPMLVHSIQSYFVSHDERIDDTTVADILNLTITKLWEQASRFPREELTFDRWLTHLTRQSIIDSEQKRSETVNDQKGTDAQNLSHLNSLTMIESPINAIETSVLLREILDQLTEKDQLLLELLMSGMTYGEIAESLGTSDAATRMRLHRLIRTIRNRLTHDQLVHHETA